MAGAPNVPRVIEEAAGYVRDTIKHFTEDDADGYAIPPCAN
ncbi:hypothetical protein [Bradyrhizobium sp.]|nr:hypothetical protein [Bradyrhizobium sp.]